MNPIVKWGLILGGGWLVIRNFDLSSIFGGMFPDLPGTSGATPGAVHMPGTMTNGNTAPAGAVPPATPVPAAVIDSQAAREALMQRAALGDPTAIAQADAAGLRQNADQWSYWRTKAGGAQTTVDLFPEGNRDFQMLASDYAARRKSAGLSGLRGWR